MPLVLLIRHGENDFVATGRLAGRQPNVQLNERGQKEARKLAEALANVPITTIYSSPLERAVATAKPIAQSKGLEIQTTFGLIETNCGDWTNQKLSDLKELPEWKIVQDSPSRFRFPNGESFHEEQTRLVAEIERIIKLYKDEDIVALVFHADPIKLTVAYYLGMPLDYFQRIACDTGSVTALYINNTGAVLLKQNLRPPFKFSISKKK
jgi:probable phosphomutase (TIGR03848 family)